MALLARNYRERCIQERAYEIWESKGRPAGRPSMYRNQAEREFAMKEGSLEPNRREVLDPARGAEKAIKERATYGDAGAER